MSAAFCTVITHDFIPFAKTLFQSIRKFDHGVDCFALVIDRDSSEIFSDFEILLPKSLSEAHLVKDFYSKYQDRSDALRWSLKSVLMIHLLKTGKYDQVFFVDPDLYFVGDFKFLYQELADQSFLLSPNWGCLKPEKSELYFQNSQTDGIYNAGFLGATIQGLDTLRWWAKMCLNACEINRSKGLHDDQGYLNHFPIRNPDARVISHRGCNVAEWNRFENIRGLNDNGEVVINGIYPLIFIHFSNIPFLVEHDPLLIPYLKEYELELKKNGFEGDFFAPALKVANRRRLMKLSITERIFRKLIGHSNFAKFKGWTID